MPIIIYISYVQCFIYKHLCYLEFNKEVVLNIIRVWMLNFSRQFLRILIRIFQFFYGNLKAVLGGLHPPEIRLFLIFFHAFSVTVEYRKVVLGCGDIGIGSFFEKLESFGRIVGNRLAREILFME